MGGRAVERKVSTLWTTCQSLSGTTGGWQASLYSPAYRNQSSLGVSNLWLLRVIQAVLHSQIFWLPSPQLVPSSPLQESLPSASAMSYPSFEKPANILYFSHNHCHNRLCFKLYFNMDYLLYLISCRIHRDSTITIVSIITLHTDVSQTYNPSLLRTKIQCPSTSNS